MEQGDKSDKRQMLIGVAGAVAVILIAFAVWELAVRNASVEEEYKIDFWVNGQKAGKVSMSQLETLPTVSYLDTYSQSAATDEGPMLKDVILLLIHESALQDNTSIHISSDLTYEERNLTWGEISNPSNSYILDFTNKGTTKLTSPDTPKNKRVRDVTDIEIGE